MKLLYCRSCFDVVALRESTRACACGRCSGAYQTDGVRAWIKGPCLPLGFDKESFERALNSQPPRPPAVGFRAFVIERDCPTIQIMPLTKESPPPRSPEYGEELRELRRFWDKAMRKRAASLEERDAVLAFRDAVGRLSRDAFVYLTTSEAGRSLPIKLVRETSPNLATLRVLDEARDESLRELYRKAEYALGSANSADMWMNMGQVALQGRVPREMLHHPTTRKEVERLISLIESGDYP